MSAAPEAGPEDAQQPLNLAAKPRWAQAGIRRKRRQRSTALQRPRQPLSRPGRPSAQAPHQPAMDRPRRVRRGSGRCTKLANFRIFHADARLAEKAAEAAESVRAAQAKRWGSAALQKPWTPRCEIYLYPTGKAFAEATGQPETSPGFSTMESNGNRITVRRVLLRADHPRLLAAILPHEVTHVVVADLFIVQQIPRWADEGIAVLAEPSTEQNLRAADLQESLSAGQVFELRKLMSTDTPDAKDWSLYYAQSVSLTRFLVEQGTPEQLIQFVRESGRKGIEAGPARRLPHRWIRRSARALASLRPGAARREQGRRSG